MSAADVVLCNFGGPTSQADVEPFLVKLFEDPFIIRAPLPIWLRAKLARRIARKRAPTIGVEYEKIGFSPINRMTDAQARHLQEFLRMRRPGVKVHVVNRYTPPFASDVVPRLDPVNRQLFVTSLYPHLCHSTTVSSYRDFDIAFENHFGHRFVPSTRVFSWWHNAKYLDYSTARLQDGLGEVFSTNDPERVTVLFSAHGIPMRYERRGDPYVNEIHAHFTEMKRRASAWLGATKAAKVSWNLSFQSRVGPVEWVKPYTDVSLRELGRHGGSLLMVPISFTSDHIETLFEMDHTYRELAIASGFKSYARVKPGNDDPALAACMADVLATHGF